MRQGPRYGASLNSERISIARLQSYQQAQLSEITNYANGTSFAQVRAARRWYGTLPLTVLTASRTVDAIGPQWLRLHQELATLSSRGVQCTVADSGHYVQLDRPQAVIGAITNMLAQARAMPRDRPANAAAFDYTAQPDALAAPLRCTELQTNQAPS